MNIIDGMKWGKYLNPNEKIMIKQNRFPKEWDEDRVKHVLDHFENQTEDEAVAEPIASAEFKPPIALLFKNPVANYLGLPCEVHL